MSGDFLFNDQGQDSAPCPKCGASDKRKHGKHLGKQRYYCKRCGLAFTGSAYHYRPSQETAALTQENQRLLKIVEAARRMEAAVEAYLKTKTGKSLSNLKAKRERLARLLAAAPYLERKEDQEETSSKTETPPGLFDV